MTKDDGMFRQSAHLLTRHIAGETIVIPIRGRLADMQRIFALNEVGEHVWRLIEQNRSVDEICAAVEQVFDISRAEAESDVREFLAELQEAGLVETLSGG